MEDPGRFGFARQLADGSSSEGERRDARQIQRVKNSIGYVDYAQASQLALNDAVIQNRSGGSSAHSHRPSRPPQLVRIGMPRGFPRPAHRCCGRRRLSDHGHSVHPDAQVGAANENGRRTGLLQVVVGARITGSRAAWICPASIDFDRSGSRVLGAGVKIRT